MTYTQKLRHSITRSGSLLCVGVDPVPDLLPHAIRASGRSIEEQVLEFSRQVIRATSMHAAAFKVNTAFFEALGRGGWEVLHDVCGEVPAEIPLIIDAKRGDIGNTAAMYARAIFSQLRSDAVTLNPLMGLETFQPFLGDPSKAVYGLVLTSNPGASEFLERRLLEGPGSPSASSAPAAPSAGASLAETIASHLASLQKEESTAATLGMVVGATRPEVVSGVLTAFPEAPLLIPGIGAQGGDPAEWRRILQHHPGIPLFNASRSILYPTAGHSEEAAERHSPAESQAKGDGDWVGAIAAAAKATQAMLPDHTIVELR